MFPGVAPKAKRLRQRRLDVASLVKACQRQDWDALRLLVDIFKRPIAVFLMSQGCSPLDSEEIANEAFSTAWARIFECDPKKFKSWLFVIAKNTFVDRGRREQALRGRLRAKWCAARLEFEQAICEKLREGKDSKGEELLTLVGSVLSADERRLLHLRCVQELSTKEIAEILGVTPKAIRVRMTRIRKKIQRAWLRRQGEEPDGK